MPHDRHRSIWRTPETYIGAAIVIGLFLLGVWYAGGFTVFFVARPVIQG